MVEVLRTPKLEVALDVYRDWLDRSIQLGFYPSSVALMFNGKQWSILVTELLRQADTSMPF